MAGGLRRQGARTNRLSRASDRIDIRVERFFSGSRVTEAMKRLLIPMCVALVTSRANKPITAGTQQTRELPEAVIRGAADLAHAGAGAFTRRRHGQMILGVDCRSEESVGHSNRSSRPSSGWDPSKPIGILLPGAGEALIAEMGQGNPVFHERLTALRKRAAMIERALAQNESSRHWQQDALEHRWGFCFWLCGLGLLFLLSCSSSCPEVHQPA